MNSFFLKKNSFYNFLISSLPTIHHFIYNKGDFKIVVPRHKIYDILFFLNKNTLCQFKLLSDISAVDLYKTPARFIVNYHILSVRYNIRLDVRVFITDKKRFLQSVTPIYGNALWSEREVWDLFGIGFLGNPDLRRILTDYGFTMHPLCKDFPITGYTELFYSNRYLLIKSRRCLVYNEYRNYFSSKYGWNSLKS